MKCDFARHKNCNGIYKEKYIKLSNMHAKCIVRNKAIRFPNKTFESVISSTREPFL